MAWGRRSACGPGSELVGVPYGPDAGDAVACDVEGENGDRGAVVLGDTLPVPLKPEINGFGVDPFARDPAACARARFTAAGEINRMGLGVSHNGPVPGGVLPGEKALIPRPSTL
jgi:hypothetical protein